MDIEEEQGVYYGGVDEASAQGTYYGDEEGANGFTAQTTLCCLCGVVMDPNASGMCVNCLRSQVDITEGIPKQLCIQSCRGCARYLHPPNHWVECAWESPRLLSSCLKRIRGLGKVKLIDAAFVYTEPHSKRIKVKVTVQKEVRAANAP